jgi:hypothetical protein
MSKKIGGVGDVISVTIHWGDYVENHRGILPETYEFESQAELAAFLYGAEEATFGHFYVIEDGGRCELCGADADGHIEEESADEPSA